MVKILLDGVVVDRDLPEQSPPTSDEVRSMRNNKLRSEVDVIAGNALRWAALSSEKQAEWSSYRTYLLDVPQQSGFPNTITWPTKPEGN